MVCFPVCMIVITSYSIHYTKLYELRDLIPYKIDNIRIEYAGENISNGYTVGADFKINGEFVPGAESWMSYNFV